MHKATQIMVLTVCAALAAGVAQAADYTWTGTTSQDFEVAANWGGTAPADNLTSDRGIVLGAPPGNTPTLTVSRQIYGLDFQSAGWSLGGAHALTVGAGGIGSAGSGINSVSAGLSVGASSSWTVGSGNTLEVSGVLGGAGGHTLTKAGSGTLKLTNTENTISGPITISSGIVRAENSGLPGSSRSGL